MEQSYLSQLEKHYKYYLQNLVAGNDFEPIILRGGKNKPANTVELHKQVAIFQKNEKNYGKPGWTIEWEDWSSKKLGNQKWPKQIHVSTEEDLLFLTGRKKHAEDFKLLLANIVAWKPALYSLIQSKPELIHDHSQDWQTIQRVVDFLLRNDTENLYLRSIPVPAHTKFLHNKRGLLLTILKHLQPDKFLPSHIDLEDALRVKRKQFLFPMRLLDAALAKQYMSGIDSFAIAANAIQNNNWEIKKVVLVENETNLYLLPPMQGTLAIFSCGKALHLLKDIELFHTAKSFYWGDLDEEGFKMLNSIKSYYPNLQSLFMDQQTVTLHDNEMHVQPYLYKNGSLEYLSQEEIAAYDLLSARNGRIEQERLHQDYVMERLAAI